MTTAQPADPADPELPDNLPAPIVENPTGKWLKPILALVGGVVVTGGVVLLVRRQRRLAAEKAAQLPPATAVPTRPVPTMPTVDDNPWDELDRLMNAAPQPQPIEAEGDGDTAAGLPYIWRVYGSIPGTHETYQAIVMIPDDDGAYSYWGDDPATPHFVMASSVDAAMDKILEWANAH